MRFAAILFFLPFLLFASAKAVTFRCNASTTAKCQSLVGYVSQNATTFDAVSSLFQVPLNSILAANNLPFSTPSINLIPANSTTRVPIPCSCSNGTGTSAGVPMYTVKSGDGLDAIARYTFDNFVTSGEIAMANSIQDPNNIKAGQNLSIPLPCSCDPVEGKDVVHLAHVVAPGSSLEAIATEFGTSQQTLMSLNGINDPKSLQAYQTLDVPLTACSSSISNTSADHDLRLFNGSYAITANGCILCSCSSSSYQLDCQLNPGPKSTKCPFSNCALGTGTSLACCVYNGFSNSTDIEIFTSIIPQNSCPSSPASPPSGSNDARRLGSPAALLIVFNIVLLCFGFL